MAIMGVSPALAKTLLEEARSQAKWIGIKHIEIETSELDQKSYSKNSKDSVLHANKNFTSILHFYLKILITKLF